MNWKIIIGIMLIMMGAGLFAYYDRYVRPEREAREMLSEASMVFERADETGDRDSVNQAISTLSRLIAKYPETRSVNEAFFMIGRSYEKLNLYRLAYLKYSTLIRNSSRPLSPQLREDVLVRLAHINILKRYSEEGVHQLYSILNTSSNKDMRGRIYTELGHTYLNLGQYDKARRMFDISLHENGGNEDAILGKARVFKRMGRDSAAYDLYDYFLRYFGAISPYTGDVRRAYREQAYWSGLREYRQGRYGSAISFFNRVMRNFPGDSKTEYALYWTGESYFSQRDFNRAINYFNSVLSNGFYQKDQDARIKKGYAYFMSRRFDLAAREFQTYLRDYPRGKYSSVAQEWRGMSTRELLYRIESQKLPDAAERKTPDPAIPDEGDISDSESVREPKSSPAPSRKVEDDEEVSGLIIRDGRRIDLDIVTEL